MRNQSFAVQPLHATLGLLLAAVASTVGCNRGAEVGPDRGPAPAEAAARVAPAGEGSAALKAMTGPQLAERMAEVTGATRMMNQMLAAMKQQMGAAPQGKEMVRAFEEKWPEMMNRITPVYAKHLSNEEMIAVIQFHESPAGKAMMEKMPLIIEETMQIGQEWAQQVLKAAAEGTVSADGVTKAGTTAESPPGAPASGN